MKRWLRRLATSLYSRFPWLVDRWVRNNPLDELPPPPWTPFPGPLHATRLGVVTTAGVHLADDVPFDMADSEGDPSWRRLPTNAPVEALQITHDSYDTRDARRDINVVYPIARLQEIVDAGRLGGLVDVQAGLMGHVDGPHVATLTERTAPAIAAHFRAQGADLVLLAPA